jgi:hypothetical protein
MVANDSCMVSIAHRVILIIQHVVCCFILIFIFLKLRIKSKGTVADPEHFISIFFWACP